MKLLPGNAQHIGGRESQQDSFAFSDIEDLAFAEHAGCLGLIADGMGGLARGGEASRAATAAFLAAYQSKTPIEGITEALHRSLDRANQAVAATVQGEPQDRVGSTLTAVVLHKKGLHWISVGDTRVYLARGGKLTQISRDHNLAADLDRLAVLGEIGAKEAREDPQREALTSYLGGDRIVSVDANSHPIPLVPGDQVLLCSDGFYRALSAEEILGELHGDPQLACERLLERVLCKNRPGQDNATVLALAYVDHQLTLHAGAGAANARLRATLDWLQLRLSGMLHWLPLPFGILLLVIFLATRSCTSSAPRQAPPSTAQSGSASQNG